MYPPYWHCAIYNMKRLTTVYLLRLLIHCISFFEKVKKSTWLSDNIPSSIEPSGPPEQVTLGDVTSTSIKVTWAPVKFEDRNGIIKGYKVIYRALPNGPNVTKVVNTENALTIGGLNEFTNYSIRVLAFTAVGDGPLSVAQVKQTLEDSKFVFDISAVNVTLKYTVAALFTHYIDGFLHFL